MAPKLLLDTHIVVRWLADLAQSAGIPQAKCMKLGESWAKVFTTVKAG